MCLQGAFTVKIMFIKTIKIKRGDKQYQYYQLVESYRREDGTPSHRLICNLKGLTPLTIKNLKVALQAGKQGQPVVIGTGTNKTPTE